jgi:hypothetical protein
VLPVALALLVAAAPEDSGPDVRRALAITAGVATSATISTGAVIVAAGISGVPFQQTGRPNAYVSTLGVAAGVALNFGLVHLLVPEFVRVVGAAVPPSRLEAWRWSRWALAAQVVGVAALGLGAGLEAREFGAGQGLMLGGLLGALFGGIALDVLELVGAWRVAP